MPVTKIDAHGNEIYITDPSGNEIGPWGKIIAGCLMVIATLFTVLAITAHWPDKLPPVNSEASTKYEYKWFKIKYLGKDGRGTDDTTNFKTPANTFLHKPANVDSTATSTDNTDSAQNTTASPDSPKKATVTKPNSNAKQTAASEATCKKRKSCTIDLNTLILILVALSGFLGNMIHIASSFTNFIGAGKFKRSWMLWYCVKPFTAAALAVGVYIIFRAGFLNSAEATASVNLYGVVAIALLAGLFTDMATQKLKEVFGVVFQSSTVRPNPLDFPPLKITSTNPAILPLNTETEIVISGMGFGNRTLKLKIEGEEIKGAIINPNSIVFKYTATKDKPQLFIYDEKGVEICKHEFVTAGTNAPQPVVVTDVTPANLTINTATEITITGTALDTATLVIKVADAVIPDAGITKTADTIKFSYTAAAAGNIAVVVEDDKGTVLLNKAVTVA